MSKLAKALAALPYAHLLGMAATAKADDGEDDKKQRADESDEDYAKRMEEDDETTDKKDKENDAKKAEEDEKKKEDAKKAEEEDDDDKEKAARTAERARCAAIFGCAAAGVRPDVAAHLAFATDMSSSAAIAMLGSVAAGASPRSRNLASRMAEVQTPNVGTEAGAAPAANSPQGVAARIIAAGKLRRGES